MVQIVVQHPVKPGVPLTSPPPVGIAWFRPFEHALKPQTKIDGIALSTNISAIPPIVSGMAWRTAFEHTLTPQRKVDGLALSTNIAAIPAIVSGQAWQRPFEHILTPSTRIDGPAALSTNISAIPAIVSGVAWRQQFEHTSLRQTLLDGVINVPQAFVSPSNAWRTSFEHRLYPKTLIDGIAPIGINVASSPVGISGQAWQVQFEHALKPQTKIDGAALSTNIAVIPAIVSGEAWQRPFEHALSRQTTLSNVVNTPQPFVPLTTSWLTPFDHRLSAKTLIDGSAPIGINVTSSPVGISGEAWQRPFEHALTPQRKVDGLALSTNIAKIPAIISGQAWLTQFDHAHSRPIISALDGARGFTTAIPIPVWWYGAFDHFHAGQTKVDGPAYAFKPPPVAATTSAWWNAPFGHVLTPLVRVDGPATYAVQNLGAPKIAGMAWYQAFGRIEPLRWPAWQDPAVIFPLLPPIPSVVEVQSAVRRIEKIINQKIDWIIVRQLTEKWYDEKGERYLALMDFWQERPGQRALVLSEMLQDNRLRHIVENGYTVQELYRLIDAIKTERMEDDEEALWTLM